MPRRCSRASASFRARHSDQGLSGTGLPRHARDPFLFAVCALGLTQITAWGTAYYCLGVLAVPIAAETGWSRGFVYSGFTAALLAMGAVSAWAGKAIDHHGAQRLMSAGTVLLSLAMLLVSLASSEATYLLAWAFLGVAMRFCLYDASFAGLVQVLPSRGRQAISYLTLFGAFASTIFWNAANICASRSCNCSGVGLPLGISSSGISSSGTAPAAITS